MDEERPRWKQELGLAALLVLLAFAAYGQLLRPGETPYSPYSDIVAQHLAMKEVAYRNLEAGRGLPLWKSDVLAGGPALTHPQAVFTHPLHWPFLFFPPTKAAGPSVWLHLLAMGLSLQVLGRVLGLGLWARALMACSGMLAVKLILITYAGWLPVLPGLVCAPLLFAGVFRVVERPSPLSTLGLAAAGSLCLHSGHLQIFYYSVLFLAAWVLLCSVGWLRQGQGTRASRTLLSCVLAGLVAAASVAYLLLPLAAESSLSSRTTSGYDFFLTRGPYPLAGLTTFLHPEAQGTPLARSYPRVELWEDAAYFGAVAELLAIVGVALCWRHPRTLFLAISSLLSILLVFDTPLLRLVYTVVPGFSLFRAPERFLFLTSLFGFALAGVGAQALWVRLHRWGDARAGLARLVPHVLMGALLVGVVTEGIYYAKRYVDVAPADQVVPSPAYLESLASDDVHRVASIDRSTVNYGWSPFFGWNLLTGFDAYNYRHFLDLYDTMVFGHPSPHRGTKVWFDLERITRWDVLDEFNVEYLLAPRRLLSAPPHLEQIAVYEHQPSFTLYDGFHEVDVHVYRNQNARPRAYWAHEVVAVADARGAARLVGRRNLRTATVVEDPSLDAHGFRADDSAHVEVTEAGDGFLSLSTARSEPGYLVVSEIWHPGWRATLDGEPVVLRRTNLALMGLVVPAGAHDVELRFQPLDWNVARATSVLGFVAALGLGLVGLRRRKGPFGDARTP